MVLHLVGIAQKKWPLLYWLTCFFFSSLVVACATTSAKKVSSGAELKADLSKLKEASSLQKSFPTPASYYHTILGLQHEESQTKGSSSRGNRVLALKEYLKALQHDPRSVFLLERVALIYHQMGNQKDAVFYAERALKRSPSNIQVLVLLGDIYTASGESEKGFETYNKSIQLAPNQRDAYFKIAKIYADKKDLDAAEKMIYKGIEIGPPSPFSYYFLGILSTERKKLAQGLEFHEEALSLDPDFEPAHIGIAIIYELQGKVEAASGVYQHVLKSINPKSRSVENRLHRLFMKNKQFDEAYDFLSQRLEEAPGNLDLSFKMAQVLIEKKQFSEAIEWLLPVVSARKSDLRLKIYLAALYEENNEPGKAISTYQAALDKNPSAYDVRIRLGSLYFYELKDLPKALAQGELAKKIAPQRSEAYLFTGLVLHEAGRYDDAASTLLKGIEKKPMLPDLHFHLGATFDKLNRFDDMVQEMEKAIGLDAGYANALNYLGYTFADNGIRLNEAITLINRALRVRPDDGYFIDSLAWAYYRKGELQNALRLLKKAVSLVPNDPVIHQHLGEVYLKDGRTQLARKAWLRSLSLTPENSTLLRRFKEAGFGAPALSERTDRMPNKAPTKAH